MHWWFLNKQYFTGNSLFIFLLGKMIHSMVAHLDAVTSLAVDPNGIYLMSGSKGFFFTFYMFLYKLHIYDALHFWQI